MVEQLVADYGYLGIIVFLVLTGCGLPLPEELGVIAAGIFSARGQMDTGLAFASCMVGCLLGDSVMYFVGHRFGRSLMRTHPFLARLIHADRERQIEALIHRHGMKVFFVARFLVGLRGPIYIAAGTLRVPFRLFIFTDLICAAIVVGLFFGLSYWWADAIVEWFRLIHQAEKMLTLALAVVGVGVGLFLWKKRLLRRSLESAAAGTAVSALNETGASNEVVER